MIVDTSALLAYFNDREPDHQVVAEVIDGESGPLVVSPFVLAEVDYLVATRIGVEAELAVVEELSGGAWELPAIGVEDLRVIHAIVARYADQAIGVGDASLLVLAERYGTRTIATLDRRHFEVLRPLSGDRFTIVP